MTTTQRGYGSPHQRRRARLLPLAIGKPCDLCGETMHAEQKLDLDHTISAMLGGIGDRIVHAKCNRGRSTPLPGGRVRAGATPPDNHDPDRFLAKCTATEKSV